MLSCLQVHNFLFSSAWRGIIGVDTYLLSFPKFFGYQTPGRLLDSCWQEVGGGVFSSPHSSVDKFAELFPCLPLAITCSFLQGSALLSSLSTVLAAFHSLFSLFVASSFVSSTPGQQLFPASANPWITSFSHPPAFQHFPHHCKVFHIKFTL